MLWSTELTIKSRKTVISSFRAARTYVAGECLLRIHYTLIVEIGYTTTFYTFKPVVRLGVALFMSCEGKSENVREHSLTLKPVRALKHFAPHRTPHLETSEMQEKPFSVRSELLV